MLGRLRMPIQKAIEEYGKLVKGVFSERKPLGTTAYKGTKLQQALQAMVREATGDEGEMMLGDLNQVGEERCKIAVLAMTRRNMNSCLPVMFRSYQAVANPGPDCTIWEALYATMAHPDLFKSIEIIDSSMRQSFIGGELGCSNPIAHVLSEVKTLYPDRHVACILSIGAGHTRTIQVPDLSIFQRLFRTQDVVAMKQMATDSERLADEMAKRFRDTSGVYFRLNVDQGMQNMLPGSWEQLDEISAHTNAYLRKAEIHKAVEEATESIKERQCAIPTKYIDGHIPGKPIQQFTILRRCPAPTPVYTGRHDEGTQVETCITGGKDERRVCVVYGLGGVGKTQLALHVIERTRDRWDHLLYVDASSEETIKSALTDFAVVKSIGKTHEDTIRWLESCREQWLVVFDNADDSSVQIRRCIPGGHHGSIIITTRLTDLAILAKGPGSVCHLSRMSHGDGLALLIKAARLEDRTLSDSEMQAATALLQDFDYFALAIVHAGAYMGHVHSIGIAKYRDIFLSKRQCTLERSGQLQGTIDDYGKTVYTTWNMCYELLKERSRPMLWLIAFLHYDGISEDIFARATSNMSTCINSRIPNRTDSHSETHVKRYLSTFLDSEGAWDSMYFADTMADLTSCSLIDFDRVNLTYNVHVLVQDWMSTVIPQSLELALECTATLLSMSIDAMQDANSLAFRRKLVQHVNSVLRGGLGIRVVHASSFAVLYMETGLWKQAISLQAGVLDSCKRSFGDEHPATLISMGRLVTIHSALGQRIKAMQLGIQLVEIGERVLGEEDLITLEAKTNLAHVYSELCRWDEALQLQVHLLNVYKRVRGEEHASTLGIMNEIATTYGYLGRWVEAEEIQVQALKKSKQILGETRLETLMATNNLGLLYSFLGRRNEAEQQWVRAIDGYKQVLGEEHPDTVDWRRQSRCKSRH
ncbi:unnamed protein product [Rhizoctonia solani]|uniref:NB-ARC domain-containing protein n=1 Tax=Rhizoctonia solani TaxID=456999 RepID=A0A8H3GZ60_9AGAM|nr:unnamed protein product [Rhizoctonia solani]